MSTTACMGGWCTKRGHCAHYHATDTTEPAERLCPPGQDGAGFITLQPLEDDMPRYKLGAEMRARILDAVRVKPMPLLELADALNVHITNLRSTVAVMCSDGDLFTCRARGADREKHEVWAFADMAQRNAFAAECQARTDALQRRYQAEYRERVKATRAEHARRARAQVAERKAAERLARAQAEQKAREIRLAEREIAKQRERHESEAKTAEKARARAEAKKTQQRLKAETRAAGKLAKPDNTARPAPVRVAPAPRNDAPIIIPANVRITRAPSPPDRWAVSTAPSVISSSECRKWAKAVTA